MNHDPACPELDSGTPILDLFRIMVEAIFLFCHPELVSGSHLFHEIAAVTKNVPSQ
jgi:hypothetical protein